jgi:hypothetical protein
LIRHQPDEEFNFKLNIPLPQFMPPTIQNQKIESREKCQISIFNTERVPEELPLVEMSWSGVSLIFIPAPISDFQ